MGMMNNCHFRVKVHVVTHQGALALQFEHPTVAANGPGGWMVPKKATDPQAQAPPPPKPAQSNGQSGGEPGAAVKTFTKAEVAQNDHEKSAWIIHEGRVYDCTPYLKDHPGGAESILLAAGQDATEEFDAIHSTKAKAMLADYYIGDLAPEGQEEKGEGARAGAAAPAGAPAVDARPRALDPKRRIAFRLVEKEALSHDTRRLRFALQSSDHVLGLPVGMHMLVASRVEGKLIMRAYTPISSDDDVGYFELVVKVYFPLAPKFPKGGIMSQRLDALAIGDEVEVKGPLGHVSYQGRGAFTIHKEPVRLDAVGLIAGGTGITPCYQIIKAVLKDAEDRTRVHLLYANKTEDDILLRAELDGLAAAHPDRFALHYTLDSPPAGWTQFEGFITQAMLETAMPAPNADTTKIMMCGPPPMIKYACVPNLDKLGYAEGSYLAF